MPLIITRKAAHEMQADRIIYICQRSQQDIAQKESFLKRCIQKLRTAVQERYICYVYYTDFSSFEKEYEKALDQAVRHGCETVAVSCGDQAGVILARKFSQKFAREKDLKIWLCLPADVMISGSAITKLKDLFFENKEPMIVEMCIPVEREYASSMSDEEDDGDYGFLEEEYFAPPLMSPTPPLQSKEPKIQSERPESRKIGASAPRESKTKSNSDFRNLKEFLKQNDAGFKDTLLKYIERTGKKDSEVYKKANVDRRLFSKILNVQGYNPSKPTAIAFAIALELDLEETKDLIGRAGYTLSQASTFDRIIEFFILESNYDIFEINEALFYFDQSLLGC